MTRNRKRVRLASILAAAAFAASAQIRAQQANPPVTTATEQGDDEVVQLTPFEVSAGTEQGYNAATTLAGNRLNTDLRDIGNAVSVVTSQFLRDTGAVDNKTLLQYLPSGEVGSVYGNFAGTGDGATPDESGRFVNPNQNTRVRGLTSADNTRDFFLTDIPWDGYNIDRVDFQRGPNSILFGQGSPAGIINAGTKQAGFKNSGELELRLGSFGSTRQVLNVNRVLLPNELSFRLALLRNDEKFQQEPAYSLDKRLFAATRYEPGFLKKGSARTILKANVEFGDIDSNQPRTLPPIDLVTPWFQTGTYQTGWVNPAGGFYSLPYLNRTTYNPSQLQDDNTGLPNHGQMRPSQNNSIVPSRPSGSFNQWYQPWIANFGQQFASPMLLFNGDSSTLQRAMLFENQAYWGINTAGERAGGVLPFHRPGGVSPYSQFAVRARLPFWDAGLHKDKSLTDPSVFDFYNQLLDGPNKKEWQNFRTYNISLAQTFFDDQLGIEGVYNNEWWKGGQKGLFSSWRQAIGVDIMSNYLYGGSPDVGLVNQTSVNPAIAEPWGNGQANPNVGRPYVTDNAAGTNNQRVTNRQASRLTAFARHDFTRDSWMPRVLGTVLGQHTVTGLYAEDERFDETRNWQRYGTDAAWRAFVGINPTNNIPTTIFNANERTPNPVIYLGPSLANRTTASGANIPRIYNEIEVPKTVMMSVFDSHWKHPLNPSAPGYVNPADPWENGYYPVNAGLENNPRASTQSQNPANYVGWAQRSVNIINADESQAARDLLTTSARLSKNEVKSKALVWQGHLWKKAFVGTAGIRKDTAKGWNSSQDTNTQPSSGTFATSDRNLNFDPNVWRIYENPTVSGPSATSGIRADRPTSVSVESKSYSVVAHLTELFRNPLPFEISLFWAKSKNFQPFSNRVDLYGQALGAPEGKTEERGILISTKDNKYSLKLNKYKTESINQSSSALGGAWFIGSSQAWAANWVNRFEFNWTQDTNAGAVPVNDPTNSMYNYAPAPGETLEQAQAREASVIAAWRAWQKSVNPAFYQAWGINLNDPTRGVSASVPAGYSVTEDSISKGYEIELNANLTRNWRLAINASKTDATRVNVGGAALTDFISKYEAALKGGAPGSVGDLRIWWGGAGNETTLLQWNTNIGSEYHQRKLQEGTNAPELREWRANAITNYDFDHGFLKGFSVGGGLRWQSDIVIGYRPFYIDPANPGKGVSYDMANPYKGPSETAIDLWTSYRRKLTDRIEWSIQLNVRNVNYGGDALIPVNIQPDGSAAAFRIRPPRTWQLTNTFRF